MKKPTFSGFALYFWGALSYIGIFEITTVFWAESPLLRISLYSALFCVVYTVFLPLSYVSYHYIYSRFARRIAKTALSCAVFVTAAVFAVHFLSARLFELYSPVYILFTAQVWLYAAVICAVADSYIRFGKYICFPYIISGAFVGLFITAVAAVGLFLFKDIYQRYVYSYLILKINTAKLRILNGPLRGYIFTLDEEINVIGNQYGDEVNLMQYQDINHAHAKIIRSGPTYSVSDNDPYCRTLLNYMPVDERMLKNRDIITKQNISGEQITGFVGVSENIEGKIFRIDHKPAHFADVLTFYGGSDKFYSDPAKIEFAYEPRGITLIDNNMKNSLYVNRRRFKKVHLKDGDLLEAGDIKLIFIDDEHAYGFNSGIKADRFDRKNLKTRMPEHLPSLVSFDNRKKHTYLTKNLTYIGKSETNDIVLKVRDVGYRHAVIRRISGKYKLTDLTSKSGTYINGKRYDEKFLTHGDEITFDTAKFKFIHSDHAKQATAD
ncbi:hypothetical protein CHS0354_035365 [Potamilus streckersoni]|uniref:FHA domain-containing protein n=1 Tax=Potamilus streckersoni TaxID=2493646 RepID=A0AAE0S369_9BIVA|nr:hypothetical protein CHS0354_035365 [Potamilus streckersoni]